MREADWLPLPAATTRTPAGHQQIATAAADVITSAAHS